MFYVFLFKQYYGSLLVRSELFWSEEGFNFEVEQIIMYRLVWRRLQFFVLWKGYLLTDVIRESASELNAKVKDMVQDYVRSAGLSMLLSFDDKIFLFFGAVVINGI